MRKFVIQLSILGGLVTLLGERTHKNRTNAIFLEHVHAHAKKTPVNSF